MLQLWINFLTCPWCHKILSHTMLNCDIIWCIVTRVALVILPSVLTTGCEIWFKGLSLNYVTCTIFLQQNDFATDIIFIWFGPITDTVMPYKHNRQKSKVKRAMLTLSIYWVLADDISKEWVHHCFGNGLLPVQCQAIPWSHKGSLSIGLLRNKFSEIWIKTIIFIQENAFENVCK